MLLSTVGLLLQLTAAPVPQNPQLLRDARAAQARFEVVRRMHLPLDRTGGSPGRCDARIGRYCYWYDPTEPPAVPLEPKRIAEARANLLAFLDSAGARNPSDGWIAGQRIRYLIEAGRANDAVNAARSCRAERWWCAALEGLSLHVGERYTSADSAFAVALSAMPDAQRCEWLDLSNLVTGHLAHELSHSACEERARLADRLWTLGQPLWSTTGGGNDLRTEHFARLTMAAVLARSANAHGMSWGDDSRELLLRYGWAEWFTRQEPPFGEALYASPGITGHDREPSFSFFPDVASLRSVPRLSVSTWRLGEAMARSRYAPRHVKGLSELPHQLVRFRRGDSMLVAVAYEVSDTGLMRDSLSAALGVYHDSKLRVGGSLLGAASMVGPGGAWSTRGARGTRGTLSMTVPNDTMVVSVEVRGEHSERAARARYTIDPLPCDARWCLSDLLLFDAARASDGVGMDAPMANAITDMRYPVHKELGVFWEVQGTPGSELVWLGLRVEPLRAGLARRLAARFHLARNADPVRLRWRAAIQSSAQAQSVTLRLPSGARGKYRVLLTVETPNGPTLSASREIEVVP